MSDGASVIDKSKCPVCKAGVAEPDTGICITCARVQEQSEAKRATNPAVAAMSEASVATGVTVRNIQDFIVEHKPDMITGIVIQVDHNEFLAVTSMRLGQDMDGWPVIIMDAR